MDVTIEVISSPFYREDPGSPGDYFKLQTLTAAADVWADIEIEVCDEGFTIAGTAPGPTAACSGWTAGQTTGTWRTDWEAASSPTGTLGTGLSRAAIGTLDASLKEGNLYATAIQSAPPSCGTQVLSGPAYEADWILDNIGVGLVTADVSLEDTFPDYTWTGGTTRLDRKFSALWDGANSAWKSNNPGTVLPLTSLNPSSTEDGFLAENGPSVPVRTAYGRIQWDYLWHGTCVEDTSSTARWCLPDEHPRLAYDPSVANSSAYPSSTHLIPASECVNDTCNMDCPPTEAEEPDTAAPADPTHIFYDFRMLTAWLDETYDGETIPVGSGSASYIESMSQRAALRIVPYSEYKWSVDNTIGGVPVDWVGSLSLPSFLTSSAGCNITPDDSGTLHAAGPVGSEVDPHDWTWIEPSSAAYADQHELLVAALTNQNTTVLDGVEDTPGSNDFLGIQNDPRVFSVDLGAVGSFGEWNIAGADDKNTTAEVSFRIEADLSYASSWTPSCRVTGTPDTYSIQTTAWWALLIAQYEGGFPTESGSDHAWPHLVGKHDYPDTPPILPIDSDPTYPDNPFCYRPQEYLLGRRGTFDDDDDGTSEASYTARQSGQRFDAWGRIDIRNKYGASRETAVAQSSESWKFASYQAEMVDDWPKLASVNSSQVEYGIWDLEETVRYSVANHYSLFNFKGSHVPFAKSSLAPLLTREEQELTDSFCDCYPSSTACAAHALNRLLTNVGPRIHLFARSYRRTITTAEDLRVRARFANLGNAPSYQPTQLEFGFVDRDDFDYLTDYTTVQTYPRPSRGPTSSDLSTLISDRQDVPLTALDPRDLLPADTPSLTTLASRSTTASYSGADAATTGSPFPWGVDPADAPYGSCARGNAVDSLGGYYSLGQTGTSREIVPPTAWTGDDPPLHLLDILLDPPSTAGDYMLVYRFRDLTVDGLTGADHRPIHLDLPMDSAIGDATEQRWHLFGYVDVETP